MSSERRLGMTAQTLLLIMLNGLGAFALFLTSRYLGNMEQSISKATSRMEQLYEQHEFRLDDHEGRLTGLEYTLENGTKVKRGR